MNSHSKVELECWNRDADIVEDLRSAGRKAVGDVNRSLRTGAE